MQGGVKVTEAESKPVDLDQIRLLRESAEGFLSKEASLQRLRRLRLEKKGFDRVLWRSIAEMGWTGLRIPEQYGGLGLGLGEMAAVAELCGVHLLPEPLVPVAGFAAQLLALGGNSALQARLLPLIASGELIAAVAWQGVDLHCTDTAKSGATAVRTGDGFDLSGGLRFIRPGADCDGYLVSAVAAEGLVLCWLPANTSGMRIQTEVAADGSLEGRLVLERVRVPAEQVLGLGAAAASALRRAFDETLVLSGAELLGVARRALDITLEYLRTRVQFGRPIGSFQSLQHRAVDLLIQKELASALVDEAVACAASKQDADAFSAMASRVKSRCGDAAFAITREAIQLHGAIGFTDECDIGLYLKRAMALSAWLGNGAQHRRRYASLAVLPGTLR